MAGGTPVPLDIASGLAQGLAGVYGEKRRTDTARKAQREGRQQELGMQVLGHLIESGRVADYNDLVPFVDLAFGTTGQKPKKGEISHHAILQQVLQPGFAASSASAEAPTAGQGVSASTPAGGAADIVRSMGAPSSPASAPAAAASATPAAAPATVNRSGGLRILSDAEVLQKKTSEAETITRAQAEGQSKLAREFYNEFKDVDHDFSLYDALAMAGFKTDYNRQYSGGAQGLLRGLDAFIAERRDRATASGTPWTDADTLKARADWFAQNRSGGVNREALARSTFGLAFNQLTPEQAQEIVKKETALLGSQSYARTAGGNQADFDAPLTPKDAQATNLPVGTTGGQVKGQEVLKDAEIQQRRSTESLRTTLVDIRDRLVPAALPKKDSLGGLAPGAAYALRRRSKEGREPIAALESAVNNIVNVVARTVAEQRGTQTESDAKRAEAAIASLRDAIISGDTTESATVRINETLKIIDNVLQRLPAPPKPTAPLTRAPSRNAPAAAPAGKFSVKFRGKDYPFDTQAQLDAFKRRFSIP